VRISMRPVAAALGIAVGIVGCFGAVGVTEAIAFDAFVSKNVGKISTSGTVDASPRVVSAILKDPNFVCDLIVGCNRATKSGSKIIANIDLPGIVGQQVGIKLDGQSSDDTIDFSYSTSSALGASSADGKITLKAKGAKTIVSYRADSVKSSGVLGNEMTMDAAAAISHAIAHANFAYKQVKANQYPMGIKAPKLPKKVKAGKKITIQPKYWITAPNGGLVANGATTVSVNGKKACTIKVKNSKGSCKIKVPRQKKITVDSVFSGSFSNGMPMFAEAKISKKVSR